MTFEAKIIGEIVFFLPSWIIWCMFKMRVNRVSKNRQKNANRRETQKKYEISDCLPSHFEYICNNPIR